LIKFHFNIRREVGGEGGVRIGELEGIGGGVPMVGDYLESYIRKETAITKVGGGCHITTNHYVTIDYEPRGAIFEFYGVCGGVSMVGDYLESYIRKETAITKVGGGLYV
jgi:hypothetical protein